VGVPFQGPGTKTVAECEQLWDQIANCKSFARSKRGDRCWFKGRCIQSTDPLSTNANYITHYKPC